MAKKIKRRPRDEKLAALQAKRRSQFIAQATQVQMVSSPFTTRVTARPKPARVGALTPGNTWGSPFAATARRIDAGRIPGRRTPRSRSRRLPQRYQVWLDETAAARRSVPMAVRRTVLFRDRHRCRYCRGLMGPFHFDHVVPWSRGGPSTADNVVVACMTCNLRKGAQTWTPLPLAGESRRRALP